MMLSFKLRLCLFSSLFQYLLSLPQFYQGHFIHHAEDILHVNLDAVGDSNKHHLIQSTIDEYEGFFTQNIDHFNREYNGTFQQRYFINQTYWNNRIISDDVQDDHQVVFLCIGGEGPALDKSVLVNSVHCNDMVELAPKYNALLLALEHRYYGPSNPFGRDYSTKSLQYLNSEQALEDIASFHSFVSTKYNVAPTAKWVTWGGSYPGMMAALARLRYPTLITAAVSSSSPLQPVVDMQGYNNVVAESMSSVDVGGSTACLDAIVEGHATIGAELRSDDGIKSLEVQFNICTPNTLKDKKNQEVFAGDGVVYLPAQSNDPSCSTAYCNIASICTLMTNTTIGTPIERLAALSAIQNGGRCVNPSYDAMIKYYTVTANPERSWLYQTCTEWGFYQTCEVGSKCPYTQALHDLSVDYDICSKAFGISSDQVDYQIQQTLSRYGGDKIASSRIIFPNGQIDPWRANGVNDSPNDEEPVFLVPGASHHFWTHPSLPTDSIEVNRAREKIWKQVRRVQTMGDWDWDYCDDHYYSVHHD